MASEQPDVRAQLNALIPGEADRAALWKTTWDAYYAQYNAFRDANPGWRAFFSAHHSSALDAALEALLPRIIARGIAEGLRQATEGWEREWGNDSPKFLAVRRTREEAEARDRKALNPSLVVVSRLVGPWEPAEQPDRDPLADEPVARRLGLVDAEGRTLCRCLAGDPACPHRPTEQPEPAREEPPAKIRVRHDPGLLIEETDEDEEGGR